MVIKSFGRLARALLRVLYPGRCLLCGSLFSPHQTFEGAVAGRAQKRGQTRRRRFRELIGTDICGNCGDLHPVESPVCSCCGSMFKSREGTDHLCGDCIGSSKDFITARSPGIYDGLLMGVIHKLKYQNKIQLALPLEWFLFEFFIDTFDPDTVDWVIPVPLHPRRMRQREFNQAYLLIRHWGKLAASRGLGRFGEKIRRDIVYRSRRTLPQTGLGRKARFKNLKNAFVVADRKSIRGKRVLLVDDVYTTGATVGACSKALMTAGAGQVRVLTLARAL